MIPNIFIRSAKRLLNKPKVVLHLIKQVFHYLIQMQSMDNVFSQLKEKILIISRLIKAHYSGQYKNLSKVNLILCLAGLLYFLSPIDLIPDFIAGGFLDDLSIMTWVLHQFRNELDYFLQWEDDQLEKINIQI